MQQHQPHAPAPVAPPDFAFFDQNAHFFRAIYRQVADPDGFLCTDSYKNHPVLLALHPAFQNDDANGVPLLGKWNKRFPQRSGLIFFAYGRQYELLAAEAAVTCLFPIRTTCCQRSDAPGSTGAATSVDHDCIEPTLIAGSIRATYTCLRFRPADR